MINDEIHVGVAGRGAADIGAAPQFLGKLREEYALMDADIAHAELASPFDEQYADVGAVKLEADAGRAQLRVALPGLDGVAIYRILHQL